LVQWPRWGRECEFANAGNSRLAARYCHRQQYGGIDIIVTKAGGIDIIVTNAGGNDDEARSHRFEVLSPISIWRVSLPSWRRTRLPSCSPFRPPCPTCADAVEAASSFSRRKAAACRRRGKPAVSTFAGGLIRASKVIAKELGRDGIRVNYVCVTVVRDSPSWEAVFGENSTVSAQHRRQYEKIVAGCVRSASRLLRISDVWWHPSLPTIRHISRARHSARQAG
jgi:NAD(P)-dependent dehydrogenase (short-subunit alcohol dehydrogenase family)